jgi:hypothetical protein
MDQVNRPSAELRRQTARQVRDLTKMGLLPAEQRTARTHMAVTAQSHMDLQRAVDVSHQPAPPYAPEAEATPRAVSILVLAALFVLAAVAAAVFAMLSAAPQ